MSRSEYYQEKGKEIHTWSCLKWNGLPQEETSSPITESVQGNAGSSPGRVVEELVSGALRLSPTLKYEMAP